MKIIWGEWEEKGIIIELRREWNGIENNVMGKGGNGTRKVIPMHLYFWPTLNLLCYEKIRISANMQPMYTKTCTIAMTD